MIIFSSESRVFFLKKKKKKFELFRPLHSKIKERGEFDNLHATGSNE
jgi:hypothetical protein